MTASAPSRIPKEALPGLLLMGAMVFALVVANSPLAPLYQRFLDTYAEISVGAFELRKPLLLWINDGLMAVFFFLVGLELKREILAGELSDFRKVILPLIAAIGGIAVPALIYSWINRGDALAMNGWAIPAATDIAFALGVLALLGKRVPFALKVFLASVAVIDDLAAIVIIAVFYTSQLSLVSLGISGGLVITLFVINRLGVTAKTPYLLVGAALWVAVLKSGVHATLAGVVVAAFIPFRPAKGSEKPVLETLEHDVHPWVAFGVLPIFAFANAGVSLVGMSIASLLQPVPLGIALGLVLGKQAGVFGASLLALKTGLAKLPSGVSLPQLYGVSLLCGIGFTMSLFIGSLAFEGGGGPDYAVDDRLGILVGSFLSGVAGTLVLLQARRSKTRESGDAEVLKPRPQPLPPPS